MSSNVDAIKNVIGNKGGEAEYDDLTLLIQKNIVQNPKSVDETDKFGQTALHWAAKINKKNIATVLIDGKANLNAKDSVGWTPLHTACIQNSTEEALMLIDKGADINALDNNGEPPIFKVAQNLNEKLIDEFIAKKVDLRFISSANNDNVLHMAAYAESSHPSINLNITVKLWKAGAQIIADKSNCTPYDYLADQEPTSSFAEKFREIVSKASVN